MEKNRLKGNMILMTTAIIWGAAFVAQRVGAQTMGSFSFNSLRFLLGSLVLIPLMIRFHNKKYGKSLKTELKKTIIPGVILGSVLFIAASLQQIGIAYTTAGKAAFITGMYIIFVPLAGVFFKHKLTVQTLLSSLVALFGLYFLTINKSSSVNIGDMYQLIGAFFWTIHILLIDRFVTNYDAIKLSVIQFLTCSFFSAIVALFIESTTVNMIFETIVPILYGGILSVGVAYTLQIVGQRHARPSHAAIILSFEAVFGALAGVLLLNEMLSNRGILGMSLMFTGMILSQMNFTKKDKRTS
ncbi:MAG: DMT family transporter [Clostridiales bacterium]|nr:DMT family transporter [Clostridiales bacterium]